MKIDSVGVRNLIRNFFISQAGWPAPVPPTMPVMREVLFHTEAFAERVYVGGVSIPAVVLKQ